MHRRLAVAVAVLLCAVTAYARDPYKISTWVLNEQTSVDAFNTNNQETVNEVNPVWYFLSDPATGPVRVIPAPYGIVGGLNAPGAALVPTIQNIINGTGGQFSPAPTNWILHNPDDHAADIKALLDANPHYAGIELDYENMLADTNDPTEIAWRRDAFSTLVEKIKAQIGPDKILSVCVYRKRDVNGTYDSKHSRAQDWARLTGPYAADELKVMMYTDIYGSDELVNNTAYRQALAFGQQQIINHNKLIVSLPWYGGNITNPDPRFHTEGEAPQRSCCESRNASGELVYTRSNGERWVVMDELSTRDRILTALYDYDVGGFAFWEAGRIRHWPEVWETVRGRINDPSASVRAISPPFCPPTPYQARIDWNYTWPAPGAWTYRVDWYQWGFNTGNYTWKATGDPSSPGLYGGSYMARIHGVTGRRVFEAESPMFTITCRVRP